MAATVKLWLDERKEKTGGKFPVKVKVTFNRERKYYPTGTDMTKAQWERLKTGKRHSKEERELITYLQAFETKATDIVNGNPQKGIWLNIF